MTYYEKELGNGYCVERLEQGFIRVVGENARCDLLRGSDTGNAKPGDKGRIIMYGAPGQYNLAKFIVDNTMDFDPKPLLDAYNLKFNSTHTVL